MKAFSARHIYLFHLVVISLYLPHPINGLCIALFALNALLSARYQKPGKDFFKKFSLPLAFSLYFLINLLSMTYTEDQHEGWQRISTHLGFLVLPWAIVAAPGKDLQRMLHSSIRLFFYISLIVVLLSFAGFLFLENPVQIGDINLNPRNLRRFTGDFMHPGYLSMYIGIALMIAIHLGAKTSNQSLRYFYFLSTLPMLVFLFMQQSRMTVIAFLIVAFVFAVSLYRHKKYLVPGVLVVISLLVAFVAFGPREYTGRFTDLRHFEYDKSAGKFNGITIRLAIWEDVFKVIKEQPLFGVGIGDYRQEAVEAYQASEFKKAADREFDPHNQYLGTWLATGLLGLSCLLLLFYLLIVPPLRSGDRLAAMAGLFVALCCLSESILLRHWGVTMFASLVFFLSYVSSRTHNKKEAVEEGEEKYSRLSL